MDTMQNDTSYHRTAALELQSAMLKKAFRGYQPAQVDALVQKAMNEIASLSAQNQALHEQIEECQAELAEFREQDSMMKQILVQAHQMAAETKMDGQKEADRIIEEARKKALELEEQTRAKLTDVRWDLERLTIEKQQFVRDFRSMLESRLRDVVTSEGPFSVVEGAKRDDAANG